jgi:hypothetical protein
MHRGLEQLRAIQTKPVHRRGDEQVEILREKEARKRRDDVRQEENRQKADEDDAEQLSGEKWSDLLNVSEVGEQAIQHAEDEAPEDDAQPREQRRPRNSSALARSRTRARRQPLGSEQVQQRRVGEHGGGGVRRPRAAWQRGDALRHSGPRRAHARHFRP